MSLCTGVGWGKGRAPRLDNRRPSGPQGYTSCGTNVGVPSFPLTVVNLISCKVTGSQHVNTATLGHRDAEENRLCVCKDKKENISVKPSACVPVFLSDPKWERQQHDPISPWLLRSQGENDKKLLHSASLMHEGVNRTLNAGWCPGGRVGCGRSIRDLPWDTSKCNVEGPYTLDCKLRKPQAPHSPAVRKE